MTVAFMSLLVIPELKLGDKGLFDGRNFRFTDLME
jgi:adenine deaminase